MGELDSKYGKASDDSRDSDRDSKEKKHFKVSDDDDDDDEIWQVYLIF